MKRILKVFLIFLGLVLLLAALIPVGFWIKYRRTVDAGPGNVPGSISPGNKYASMVDPFIGTGGIPWVCANNFPGVSRPFGVMRLSPETMSWYKNKKALNYSGYYYGDDRIIGFSHTRLNGTGARDGGHFLVTPFDGQIDSEKGMRDHFSKFSHQNEVAFPGYYAVYLENPGVLAEFTAMERTGLHRYTFDEGRIPHIFLDITHALGYGTAAEGTIRVLDDRQSLEGSVKTFGTFSGRYGGIRVYFAATLSEKIDSYEIWKNGARISSGMDTACGDDLGIHMAFSVETMVNVIECRLAISHVSIENAWENLTVETQDKPFNEITAEAEDAWEDRLSLIEVEGGTESAQKIFYTALYRNFQMPTRFADANGQYIGFDKKIHSEEGFNYYTDMSLWDTYRTTHPLYNLIARKEQRDMMASLILMARQGNGLLPRWPAGHGYTGSMFGSPADMVIAEAYLKGIRDFDIEYAYTAMSEAARGKRRSEEGFSSRRAIESYLKYGYCPADEMTKAVSKTLEYAWADHSIGLLAQALGEEEASEYFLAHGQYYRNLWNDSTQYFQPRNADGTFEKKFDPLQLSYTDWDNEYTDDYAEGSALQWRWMVPHDPSGLISLFGSRKYFVDELNNFFEKADAEIGAWNPGSYYWQGNQPDIFSAYLFNSAGRPDLTQKWVRWILENKYDTSYIGLDGNDDGGTLSAWYVFSALGFYPVAGTDKYELGAPLFRRATLDMGDVQLVIVADNYAPENIYVASVWLNEQLLDRHWFIHDEIAHGGVLRFEMSATPYPAESVGE